MIALRRQALAAMVALAVAGCAIPPRVPSTGAESQSWTGRLALQVQDHPDQSFSAAFELRGSPQSGELQLLTPLGGTLAVLDWHPGRATLRAGGKTSEYTSVDALASGVTGAPIPVTALFDWLRGLDAPVQGWRADLTQLAQGRIAATRIEPPPQADLRVVLER